MNITEKIKITNEDCIDVLKRTPDKFYDLAIIDPPYGINADKAQNNGGEKWGYKKYKSTDWDKSIPNEEYFKELFRVSKNQIIWGGNYMTEFLEPSCCWVIWDKMQEFSGAVFEMAWTSFNSPAKAFRMSRVEAYTRDSKTHPTQKPVALYKWLLQKYAKPNDKILDTHLGSGSIAVACHDFGFELTACELDADYYKASIERIKKHCSQGSLFAPEELLQHNENGSNLFNQI